MRRRAGDELTDLRGCLIAAGSSGFGELLDAFRRLADPFAEVLPFWTRRNDPGDSSLLLAGTSKVPDDGDLLLLLVAAIEAFADLGVTGISSFNIFSKPADRVCIDNDLPAVSFGEGHSFSLPFCPC